MREAEAVVLQTEAEARVTLTEAESALLAAQAELHSVQERLAALSALPSALDLECLEAEIRENQVRHQNACSHLRVLQQLAEEELCSQTELEEAEHERKRHEDHEKHLRAALEELGSQGESLEVRKAEVRIEQLKCEAHLAELRKEMESERQRLLCEAARLSSLGQARRELELTSKRLEELDVRAPQAGHVLYGYRRWWWPHVEGVPPCPGKPLYYGQVVFSVIVPGQVRIEAEVAEQDLLRVAAGDCAQVSLPALPGQVYDGVVEAVLPIVEASRSELLETASEVLERHGTVRVKVEEVDGRLRPGMKALVAIRPSSGTAGNQAVATAAPLPPLGVAPADGREMPQGRPALVLGGHLETKSSHLIKCPFAGRIVRLAKAGTLVEEGDVLAQIDPGLQVEWRAQDRSELDRLEALRKAAELQVRLKEQQVPLLRLGAEADVELAQLDLKALDVHPLPSERIKAENGLAEEQWQLERARRRLEASRSLAAEGLARKADVTKRELRVASAEAAVSMARARLAEVRAGASELERAIAQSDLDLARASLEKATTLAELDAIAAHGELKAATAKLQAYRAQAERRLRKAGEGEIKSPVKGIVRWSWHQEGEEVQAAGYIMMVADMEEAVVYAMLDESDYFKVVPGAAARVELAGVPNRVYPGRVADVVDWPDLNEWERRWFGETRVRSGQLFRVVVELDEEPPMCVGMSATVELLSPPTGQDARSVSRSDDEPQEGATDGQAD